jgi:hypothetical protein
LHGLSFGTPSKLEPVDEPTTITDVQRGGPVKPIHVDEFGAWRDELGSLFAESSMPTVVAEERVAGDFDRAGGVRPFRPWTEILRQFLDKIYLTISAHREAFSILASAFRTEHRTPPGRFVPLSIGGLPSGCKLPEEASG